MKDTLTSIADGFRSSRGLTEEISPARMAELAAENVGGGGFPNGTEWALIDVQNINPDEVIYNDGLFVVGAGNGIYYSADGKTWTQSNIVDRPINTIYRQKYWYAVANQGGILLKSEDGRTWEETDLPVFTHMVKAGGIFVGCGLYCDGVYYSEDGDTWLQSNLNTSSTSRVYYVDGVWFVSYENDVYYSLDGKEWEVSDALDKSPNFFLRNEGLFVFGTNNYGLYYSTDGKTWTQSNVTNAGFNGVVFEDGIWVGYTYNKGLFYSTDGKTWTQSNVGDKNISFVSHHNSIWVAGGNRSGLLYSADGKTWTQSNIVDVTSVMVDYYAGVWVACLTMASENGLYYSIDGKEWFESNDGAEYSNFTMHTEAGHRIAHGGMNLYYSTTWEPTA